MSEGTEELWQGYSEVGEPTGPITKYDARLGALHGASHIWIYRIYQNEIQILLQRRASDKATWANHLDISAAGHIDSGETPLVAAQRETREEIGLVVETEHLRLISMYRANLKAILDNSTIIENEFQFVYLYKLEDGESELKLQDGEVSDTQWLSLASFDDLINGSSHDIIVPHGEAYYAILRKAIQEASVEDDNNGTNDAAK